MRGCTGNVRALTSLLRLVTGFYLLTALTASWLVTTVAAQDQDIIGIYFDQDGTINEADVALEPNTIYLCVLNASQGSGISGWECNVSWTGGYTILNWDIRSNGINVSVAPDFAVGLPSPLPWQPSIVLMEIVVGSFYEGDSEFYLHPNSAPSIPGSMAYAAGSDPGILVPLNWSSGSEDFPVATMHVLDLPPECTIEPAALDFGEVPVGQEVWQSFTITNTGVATLAGEVPPACGAFEVMVGAGPFSLGAQGSHAVTVRFQPVVEGEHSCNLYLGNDLCAEVPCYGLATPSPPACGLYPEILDFGEVPVGTYTDLDLLIVNTGGGILTGSVPDSCGVFTVIGGAGPFDLTASVSHLVQVRFQPPMAPADYSCLLAIEGICDDVPCSGTAIPPPPECVVDPTLLAFPDTEIGQTSLAEFTIQNIGGDALTGYVSEGCPAFNLVSGGGSYILYPGLSRTVTVSFTPLAEEDYSCIINTGTPYCSDVTCNGSGTWTQPDSDFLGIYFDETGTSNQIEVTSTQFLTSYLCILEASAPSGVSGWECSISGTEDVLVVDWSLQGTAINILVPPEFFVGLADPLPWQESIVLMEFTYLVNQPGVFEFYLHPAPIPSMPGHMIYAAGDDPGNLIPLNWASGSENLPVTIITSLVNTPECTIDPPALAFGEVELFEPDYRTFTITNTGGETLFIAVPDSCDVFQVVAGAGPQTLESGQSHTATVQFTPPDTLDYSCAMNFGSEFCYDLPCTGTGIPDYPICSLCPADLDFGMVMEGMSIDRTFTITNTGGDLLTGTVTDGCGPFTVIAGAGEFSLYRHESLPVEVRFTPPALGEYTCDLVIDGICEDVTCSGSGVEALPDCTVSPEHLGFCGAAPGQTEYQSFTIINSGGVTFSGEVTASCEAFQINAGGGTYVLNPGEQREVVVAFIPPAPGLYSCTVTTGSEYCSDVTCTGLGSPTFADPDVIAITLNSDNLGGGTNLPVGEPASLYLCLQYSSERSGVAGWECRLDWNESFPVLEWNLQGDAFNRLRPPEFAVSLSDPLPWQQTIVLMEMVVLITQPGPCEFFVQPLASGTIPDLASYQPGDDRRHIIPLNWPLGDGSQPVLILNPDVIPIGVTAPAPRLVDIAGGVELSFSYDPDLADGCHVYRRVGAGPAARVTGALLSSPDGQLVFTDPVAELPAGSTLHYSYALLQNGMEIARSPEVSLTLGRDLPRTTLLHTNYPNPFNPLTNIKFELDRPGRVRLQIFDLAGRHIRTLADAHLTAGVHVRQWDGRDDRGRSLPSGAYYFRLDTDSFSDMRKMMLLK